MHIASSTHHQLRLRQLLPGRLSRTLSSILLSLKLLPGNSIGFAFVSCERSTDNRL